MGSRDVSQSSYFGPKSRAPETENEVLFFLMMESTYTFRKRKWTNERVERKREGKS